MKLIRYQSATIDTATIDIEKIDALTNPVIAKGANG